MSLGTDGISPEDVPGYLTVYATWLGAKGCVSVVPGFVVFSRDTPTSTLPMHIVVGEGCETNTLKFTTYGWSTYDSESVSATLQVTTLQRVILSRFPRKIYVGDIFDITVDVGVSPIVYDFYQFGISTDPQTPCFVFEPKFLVFRADDNLPTRRVIGVAAICDTNYRTIRVGLNTRTSNSSLHSKYVLPPDGGNPPGICVG